VKRQNKVRLVHLYQHFTFKRVHWPNNFFRQQKPLFYLQLLWLYEPAEINCNGRANADMPKMSVEKRQ
jgi:hypothetical protein